MAFFSKLYNTLLFKRINRKKGRVIIQNSVNCEIAKNAIINVSGKLVLCRSDYKKEYRILNLKLSDKSTFVCENNMSLYANCYISVAPNAVLELHGNGYINYGCHIDCFKHISIGNGTIIAKDVYIRDSDNHDLIYDGYKQTAPIIIGDHVWIGMRSTILKGVKIGNGAIVAAGSLVNRDVPANSLVAGVPARVIKENIIWK